VRLLEIIKRSLQSGSPSFRAIEGAINRFMTVPCSVLHDQAPSPALKSALSHPKRMETENGESEPNSGKRTVTVICPGGLKKTYDVPADWFIKDFIKMIRKPDNLTGGRLESTIGEHSPNLSFSQTPDEPLLLIGLRRKTSLFEDDDAPVNEPATEKSELSRHDLTKQQKGTSSDLGNGFTVKMPIDRDIKVAKDYLKSVKQEIKMLQQVIMDETKDELSRDYAFRDLEHTRERLQSSRAHLVTLTSERQAQQVAVDALLSDLRAEKAGMNRAVIIQHYWNILELYGTYQKVAETGFLWCLSMLIVHIFSNYMLPVYARNFRSVR
jgi:hypothetical protein